VPARDRHFTESIVLALRSGPTCSSLTRAETRRVAELYGLPVTSVIELLIRAKHEVQVSSLAEEMDRLREQGSFQIHDCPLQAVFWKKKDLHLPG